EEEERRAKEEAAKAPALSPEELLALESLDVPQVTGDEEVVIEEEELVVDEDDIWRVPEPIGGGPQIRFAEDILGAPGRRGGGKRRGKGGARGNRGSRPGRRTGGDDDDE